jgi:hypothetical protein
MKAGDKVRFIEVKDPGDELCEFTVLEVRGDRVLIELVCDMPIRPMSVVPAGEVEVIRE